MREYQPKEMKEFARAMREVVRAIHEVNPNVVLYTLRGAVPIADCLRVTDPSIRA
jgi:hypothetical protein